MIDESRIEWEERASQNQTRPAGVLFRGFSADVNQILHMWHAWLVTEVFLPGLPERARILDLGCGYGRLKSVIALRRPDIQVVGQDIALGYCKMFAEDRSDCVQGCAADPPFLRGSFDGILAVTTLMYVERHLMPSVLQGLRGLLRLNARVLAIDPGRELQRVIAEIRGAKVASPTGGQGFGRAEYLDLFKRSGYVLGAKGGNPTLSLGLLIPGVARSRRKWLLSLLERLSRRDHCQSGYIGAAIHRWALFSIEG